MVDKHQIEIPNSICKNLTDDQIETMIDVALGLVPLWENALGEDWATIMTREKLRSMYLEM